MIRPLLMAFAGAVSITASATADTGSGLGADINEIDCVPHIRRAEAQLQIPKNLMLAIALVESAHQGYPHPWALNIGGKAHFAPNFPAAARMLRDGKGQPRRNIDVGCMQINMGWHLARFAGRPELALIPKYNVSYAGALLLELRQQSVNWSQAVARYHTWTNAIAQRRYLCQVIHTWNRLNSVTPNPATVTYCQPSVATR